MKVINFNNEIVGYNQLVETMFYIIRQFLLYHKTRNVLFYQNALEAARKVSKIVEVDGLKDDREEKTLDLFNNEVGKHGSQKGESYEEYWKEYFNR